MNFKIEVSENVLLLTLEGDLIGGEDTQSILNEVQGHIDNGIIRCIIDIAAVRFINSSGIGFLITVLTKFRNKEGELVVIHPSEQVKKLLIITKLNAIFNVLINKEEAFKRLADLEDPLFSDN